MGESSGQLEARSTLHNPGQRVSFVASSVGLSHWKLRCSEGVSQQSFLFRNVSGRDLVCLLSFQDSETFEFFISGVLKGWNVSLLF